eukprot:1461654-Rhodomonas_salina.1
MRVRVFRVGGVERGARISAEPILTHLLRVSLYCVPDTDIRDPRNARGFDRNQPRLHRSNSAPSGTDARSLLAGGGRVVHSRGQDGKNLGGAASRRVPRRYPEALADLSVHDREHEPDAAGVGGAGGRAARHAH